jgi:glycosyltransferase involved in cell wall biosynthesis
MSDLVPSGILCCSRPALESHVACGYSLEKSIVIPNGFDVETFRPDAEARNSVRRQLGWDVTSPVVGLVARFHPCKRHELFIEAADAVARSEPAARFLFVGDGATSENPQFAAMLDRWPLVAQRSRALGHRRDIARLTASLDVSSSTSSTEGFSNTLCEAMSCCVPCVSTDTGEARDVIGATGRIAAGNASALADAITTVMALSPDQRRDLGRAARARIVNTYSIAAIASRFENYYSGVARARCVP